MSTRDAGKEESRTQARRRAYVVRWNAGASLRQMSFWTYDAAMRQLKKSIQVDPEATMRYEAK